MSYATLIIGESGAGKSTSLRNLDPRKVLLIQALAKPLPFRSANWKPFDRSTKEGSIVVTDSTKDIEAIVANAHHLGKEIVVVDDFQYVMANEFMRRSAETGFQKFTEIGKNAWSVANASVSAAPHVRVYLMSHLDRTDDGHLKAKTIGKMLDEKICLEGMFSIVLRACKADDKGHVFTTQTNGRDTVKTPMGMFNAPVIENDLAKVDQAICDYYEIGRAAA